MFILKERRIDLVLFSENKMFGKDVQPFFFIQKRYFEILNASLLYQREDENITFR